jgi:threonine/homoserine/homoserine lactone efflux protein
VFPVLIQALVLASAGLLSVGSITLVILLLISDRGWKNGLGYALGYIGAYSLIGISVVLLGYRAAPKSPSEPRLFFPILLLVFGTMLLWLAFRNWRKPVSDKKEDPRFFSIIDKITPPKAFGFGALVSVINFKNLALFLTALSVVVLSDLPISGKIIITLLVVLVFCLSVIIPVVIYLSIPKRAKEVLNRIKEMLNQRSRAIGIFAPLLFGLIFLLKGFVDLI